MKSLSSLRSLVIALLFLLSHTTNGQGNGQPSDPKSITETILRMDSLFWQAYNTCDVEKMATFFTDDLEFYHDKGGLTTSVASLMENTKKGICGNENWRLRREVVEGTMHVFPLNNYGAILTGEHVFYILEKGKNEQLDGLARFTHVWRFKDNEWKMHRVLSYDHGPAPYINKRKEIVVSPSLLKSYAGQYKSPQGMVTITSEGSTLKLTAQDFKLILYAQSENLFFAKERDLQFEFIREGNKISKMIVHEKGNVVEEAPRMK